jgi:hypothetical protein
VLTLGEYTFYNERYLRYPLTVPPGFTWQEGFIELRLEISDPGDDEGGGDIILLSDSIMVRVSRPEGGGETIPPSVVDKLNELSDKVNSLQDDKADNLVYDGTNLQLTSRGGLIGDSVAIGGESEESEAIYFDGMVE